MVKRLTRKEAAALICDALKGQPVPVERKDGWAGILSDLVCLSPETIRNMATTGRKSLPQKSDSVI